MAFTILLRFKAMAARRHSSAAARMPLFRIFEIQCFHFLTNDQYGELLLQLLFDPDRRARLDYILEENLSPRRSGWNIEHDAVSGHDTPVLFGYLCDMPRIRRFDTALNFQKRNGILFCFDFQEEALRQVCGQRAKIESLDFHKVKALFDAPDL